MKKDYYQSKCICLMLLVLSVSMFVGCSAESPRANDSNISANQTANNANGETNQAEKSEAAFINKVWKVNKSNSVSPGQLYVFMSDGTLAISSPNGKPSFGSWTNENGNLTITEESKPYKVDILKLSEDEFNIKINDPGEGVEIEFVPAETK